MGTIAIAAVPPVPADGEHVHSGNPVFTLSELHAVQSVCRKHRPAVDPHSVPRRDSPYGIRALPATGSATALTLNAT
jgi:hypothetical protein